MKITIIGAAGSLGACTAFNIAVHSLADEIVMIDPRQNFLTHHVTDIGAAVSGQEIQVRAGRDEDMSGSDIIIVTAGTPQQIISSRREVLPHNLPIIQGIAEKIKQFSPEAVVITATISVGAMNYAMYLCSTLDRKKLIGYTVNDSIRFRMMVAQALGVKSSQVEGTVIGEHGDSQVLLFSSIRVNGKPVSVSEEVKRDIRQQVPNLMRSHQALKTGLTSGWTSAVGLASMVRAIGKNTGEMIPCSVVLDGEYGCHGLSMTVPAILGRGGVHEILEWELASDERELLEHSINVLKADMRYIEETLGISSR